jgi:protein SCO1
MTTMFMNWRATLTLALPILLIGLATSCNQEKTQTFSVKGVVQEVMPERKKVKIAHEEIPNYMSAMTMTFDVKDAGELAGLQAGDEVAFRMIVTDKDGWIDQVKRLRAAASLPSNPPDNFRRVREVDPLQVGDLVPDYRFTNELGQAVSLSDFKGKAVAFTFIFTRCPFPTFCPRMSSNFEEACKKLKAMPDASTNWHLLTITFDPQFDTPAVLKAYAQRYAYDPKQWSYLTGDLTDITAIAEQFGLLFWKPSPNDPAGISHNLRTVVLDGERRVQRVFTENEWKPEELAAELMKAAGKKS